MEFSRVKAFISSGEPQHGKLEIVKALLRLSWCHDKRFTLFGKDFDHSEQNRGTSSQQYA